MFGRNDAEKYEALFGILTLVSLFSGGLLGSFTSTYTVNGIQTHPLTGIFVIAAIIFFIAAISMIFVEYYGKKTNTTPLKFNRNSIIGSITIIFLIAIIAGAPQNASQKSSQQFEEYYKQGVNNFNDGISFVNKGDSNLKEGDVSAAIAQYEISKDFFNKAKINFELAVKEKPDTTSNLNKAKYLIQSSDYYGKGLDEFTSALRLTEKYKGTGMFTTAIAVIRNPESLTEKTSELLEIKVRIEKAKNYFELARNAKQASD